MIDSEDKRFYEIMFSKIGKLEIEVEKMKAMDSRNTTIKNVTKKYQFCKIKSLEKIEIARILNSEIKTKIIEINEKINEKLIIEKTAAKLKQFKFKKPSLIQKKMNEIRNKRNYQYVKKVYRCFCGSDLDDDVVVCAADFCKVKYYHKSCSKLLDGKNGKNWKCKECKK